MKTSIRGVLCAGAGAILTAGSLVLLEAAPARAEPGTFWNLLGIPQGTQKLRDARLNRLGNNPQRERVPPLKRIADPANLESKNPAIAAAAKIKKDQDLAPQKIKAIKYLGSIACCCPTNKEDVKNALLAALNDCTDEVRQAAATAICHAAGNPCTICNECSCCTADVMNKLNEMANEQDEKGCWKEPNPAVRQAAALALEACRRVRGPEPAPTVAPVQEEEKERRLPVPPKDPAYSNPPAKPAPSNESPKPAPTTASPKPVNKAAESPASGAEGWKVRPASVESAEAGFAFVTDPAGPAAVKPKTAGTSQPTRQPTSASPPASRPGADTFKPENRIQPTAKPPEAKPEPKTISPPRSLADAKASEAKLLVKFTDAQ